MTRTKMVISVVTVLVGSAGCRDGVDARDAPAPPVAVPAARAPEERLSAAQRLLEVDRRPQDAATAFRALADDTGVPPALRARARLGEARAERLLGRTDASAALLRDVVARGAEFPAIRDEAQAELTSLAGARTRFAIDVIDLAQGQFLDLDTGGAFGGPLTPQGGRAEIARRGDEIVWLAQHDETGAMGGAAPWIADAPWWQVTTDAGRAAWVQRLPGARPGALRFVVRLAGTAAPLPAPRDAFCVGSAGTIDVRFTADARYARWRIERRVGEDGALELRGDVTAPVYADTDVTNGVRYGYRITGITAEGDEGIPALVQGTTASRGVVTGKHAFSGQSDGFDFLTQRRAAGGGDLVFANSYGGGGSVGFLDGSGRVVLSAGAGGPPRTPWTAPARVAWPQQVEPGQWIALAIRGGGVARCRVSAPGGSWTCGIDYEVDPDHDAFGEGPAIEARDTGSDVEIRVVSVPEGFGVRRISVRDVLADGPAAELAVTEGRAIDSNAGPASVREYIATAEDAFGRTTVHATARIDRRSAQATDGKFDFHLLQGYSFDRGEVCDAAAADVVFSSSAGGISSVTLTAPGGIVNLETVVGSDRGSPSAGRMLRAVYSADAKTLKLTGTADGDSRTPESDVFVLRTRSGGWARLAIVERTDYAGLQERPVTVRFTFNPREPVFGDAGDDAVETGGLRLGPEAVPVRRRAQLYTAFKSRTSAFFIRTGVGLAAPDLSGPGEIGGAVPPSAASQEVLLALAKYRDFDKATYAFSLARRDEPGSAAGGAAPDLRYGSAGDLLEVRPGADDGSTISDLGALSWEDAAKSGDPASSSSASTASFGHVVLVALGGEGGGTYLVRVTGLVPGERVAFEWAALRDGKLRTSSGFAPAADLASALLRRLERAATVRRGGRVGVDPPKSDAARATLDRLSASKAEISVARQPLVKTLETLVRAMQLRFEVDPAVQPVVDSAEAAIESAAPLSLASILDSITRQAGICWTVDETGMVRLVPRPEGR